MNQQELWLTGEQLMALKALFSAVDASDLEKSGITEEQVHVLGEIAELVDEALFELSWKEVEAA